jgi:hypothetical protein
LVRGRPAIAVAVAALLVAPGVAAGAPADTGQRGSSATPAAAAALPAPFTDVVAFATKTGFRGVVTWSSSEPVQALVRYGAAPDALDQVAPVVDAPDTAGLVVIDDLEVGTTYYVAVEDLLSGTTTPAIELDAVNAYTDLAANTEQPAGEVSRKDEVYTIDLLVQLDAQSLPPDVPGLDVEEIAAGVNVLAERVYDALDGHARIGNVVVTDSTLSPPAPVPGVVPVNAPPPVCETPTDVADVLVTTAMPLDSHTFSYAIDDPCASFYLGRQGWLGVLWVNDLDLGHVASHELMHYAFGAPDLYGAATSGGCRNLDWDGSLLHNTGGWAGDRWEMTELDQDPVLTPCDDHEGEPYSWDRVQERYTTIADRTALEDVVNLSPRGNPDGGALDIRILDREPGASTLRSFAPDDANPELVGACAAPGSSTGFDDPRGDATRVIEDTGAAPLNEPALDIVNQRVQVGGSTADPTVTFTVEADDLRADPPPGTSGEWYDLGFVAGDESYDLVAQWDRVDPAPAFRLTELGDTGRVTIGELTGTWDVDADTIRVTVPATVGERSVLAPGSLVRGFETVSRRITAAVIPDADVASGGCPVQVPGDGGGAPPPIEADAVLALGGAPHTFTGGPWVDGAVGGVAASGCDATGAPCATARLDAVDAGEGVLLEVAVEPDPALVLGDISIRSPAGTPLLEESFEGPATFRVPAAAPGIYIVTLDPVVAAGGSVVATAALVAGDPAPPEVDAVLEPGDVFSADGAIDEAQVERTCTGPGDAACPVYVLDLRPSGATGTLSISVTTDIPVEDYDLYLYDADGREVGGVGNPGTLVESADVAGLAPGLYWLVVQPYTVTAGSAFHVEAALA